MKSYARLYASLFSCVVLAQWAEPAQASAGCLVQGNTLNPSGDDGTGRLSAFH